MPYVCQSVSGQCHLTIIIIQDKNINILVHSELRQDEKTKQWQCDSWHLGQTSDSYHHPHTEPDTDTSTWHLTPPLLEGYICQLKIYDSDFVLSRGFIFTDVRSFCQLLLTIRSCWTIRIARSNGTKWSNFGLYGSTLLIQAGIRILALGLSLQINDKCQDCRGTSGMSVSYLGVLCCLVAGAPSARCQNVLSVLSIRTKTNIGDWWHTD